jgi:hypothetical protein
MNDYVFGMYMIFVKIALYRRKIRHKLHKEIRKTMMMFNTKQKPSKVINEACCEKKKQLLLITMV